MTTRTAVFFQCDYCDVASHGDEPCLICGGAGVLPLEREDAAELADEIRDLLTPMLKHSPGTVATIDDAQPLIADLILRWKG
jgi:hypothetical protein